jgi:hypothetical protein
MRKIASRCGIAFTSFRLKNFRQRAQLARASSAYFRSRTCHLASAVADFAI